MSSNPYSRWLKQTVYHGNGIYQGTMEEAMLDFFYSGIEPWVKGIGYTWILSDDKYIAQKFLRFAYEVHCALKEGPTIDLSAPEPMHRNFPEDRDTFNMYADATSWLDVSNNWSFRDEIIGTRLEYMIWEFCYTWIDVTSGKPGKWTQTTLDITDDNGSDEDNTAIFPDGSWNRRKYDLY